MSREGRPERIDAMKMKTREEDYISIRSCRKLEREKINKPKREDKQTKDGSGVADQAEAVENHTNGRTRSAATRSISVVIDLSICLSVSVSGTS